MAVWLKIVLLQIIILTDQDRLDYRLTDIVKDKGTQKAWPGEYAPYTYVHVDNKIYLATT